MSNTKNKKLFPKKLWDLINDDKYNFCLRWSEDGQLVYLNRDDFEDSYLKTAENQFHTQKAISFVRQMNMYGFRKVDDCYYENDNFKRDCEHLLKNMIRKHPNKNQSSNEISLLDQQSISEISNTQSPRDLSMNLEMPANYPEMPANYSDMPTNYPEIPANYLNIGSENSNLNAFYALLSSMNNNLYQPIPQIQQNNQQNLAFDINRFSSLQQIYQQLLHQQDLATTQSDQMSCNDSISPEQTAQVLDKSSVSSSNKETSTSLLVRNKTQFNSSKTSKNMEGFKIGNRNVPHSGERLHTAYERIIPDTETVTKRRDNKTNRPFKRGVDSILDSNNNQSSESMIDTSKKIKIENSQEKQTSEHVIINKYAKNLVTQVALARDAKVDADVICRASWYTERFVETLFDTAQVIARHSNASCSTDSGSTIDNGSPIDDFIDDKEVEKYDINLNNLTSALKLLPSKLLKILKS